MCRLAWKKHIVMWRSRLCLYPAPEPLPRTRLFWLATGLVIFFVLLFSGFFIFYLTGRHDAYLTNAEDLGIMDQAIWNTLHGHMLRQTICNRVSDTNCYSLAGVNRFAIHFEPILLPLSLLYFIWPSPNILVIVQVLVVASGAFPAFWLARLRLRNNVAGAGIALLYLLYPAQQQGVIYDFHAVTFTASLLLFTLYFMYTRRTIWFFVFAILSMACKEEIALVIVFFSLWSILFQQRWRSGLVLAGLAIGWVGLEVFVFRLASPTGRPLLVSRYATLGNSPLQVTHTLLFHPIDVLRQHVFERLHFFYLRVLLAPAAYLPFLAPWILVLALPSIAINLLSSEPSMYSGFYQYGAEIVPVLIFATIEAIVLILWFFHWSVLRLHVLLKKTQKDFLPSGYLAHWTYVSSLTVLLSLVLFSVVRQDYPYGALPFSRVLVNDFHGPTTLSTTFQWPQTNAHTRLAQHFIAMIPSAASVSAQSTLVPHVSQRLHVYLFPYADDRADYIFLDVIGNTAPLFPNPYVHEVKKVTLSGKYGVLAAQDGYLLLKRGLAAPGISRFTSGNNPDMALPNLPDDFCSFVYVSPQQIMHPLHVTFTDARLNGSPTHMSLVGFSTVADRLGSSSNFGQITTYWQIDKPASQSLQILVLVTGKSGEEHFVTVDHPALSWCPTNTWKSGMVLSLTSTPFTIRNVPGGQVSVSIALLPRLYPFSKIMDIHARLPVIDMSKNSVVVRRANTAQLSTITIVP